jgi:hypothetical protein
LININSPLTLDFNQSTKLFHSVSIHYKRENLELREGLTPQAPATKYLGFLRSKYHRSLLRMSMRHLQFFQLLCHRTKFQQLYIYWSQIVKECNLTFPVPCIDIEYPVQQFQESIYNKISKRWEPNWQYLKPIAQLFKFR